MRKTYRICAIILAITILVYIAGIWRFLAERGGVDPEFDMGNGYIMSCWPGYLIYRNNIRVNNELVSTGFKIVLYVNAIWSDNKWIIGKAGKDKRSFFVVKKVNMSEKNFSSFEQAEDLLHDNLYYPIEDIDKVSKIVNFDVRKIKLLRKMPREKFINYYKARNYYYIVVFIIVTLGIIVIILSSRNRT